MAFYQARVLPHLIRMSMKQEHFEPYRRRVTAAARGKVLEIDVGSGLNLPLYAAGTEVVGLDPSAKLLSMAREATVDRARNIALIEGSAESIPLPDHAFDAVVTTWTMCSIPDVVGALSEIRRMLKADGRLVFAEHGLAPSAGVVRWQNALTPERQVIWRRGPHRRSAKRRLEWTATGRSPRTDHPQGSEPSGIAERVLQNAADSLSR